MAPDILEATADTEENARVLTTPNGAIALPPSVSASIKTVRDWWATSQSIGLFEIAHRGARRLIPTSRSSIIEALVALANYADRQDRMWIVDLETGHISIGTVKNYSERGGIVSDNPLACEEAARPITIEETTLNQTDLRAHHVTNLKLPTDELTAQAGSYLGRPVSANLSWPTGAAVSGGTPHFNGVGVRVLTWSAQHSSYRASQQAAFLEGIERRVGATQSSGSYNFGPGKALEAPITPDDFPSYPKEFYGIRGLRYDPNDPHEWVQVYDLRTGEPSWIAREYVYYGDRIKRHRWALSTSSGCATGSSITEAVLFGLLELIERDAYIASWYARWSVTPVDISQLPRYSNLLARAQLLGLTVEAGLLTSPFEIPVAIASVHADTISSLGTGCHPDPLKALEAAINEAWTYIPDRISMAAHEPEKLRALAKNPQLVKDIDDHPLLYCPKFNPTYRNICGTGRKITLEEIYKRQDAQWSKEVTHGPRRLLQKLLDRLGDEIRVYARIQTSPYERSLGLETCMVVSPNLLPIDFGWDCQRALQSERLFLLADKFGTSIRTELHPFS